ncbi:probable RNA methyltransferase CG11342 [Anopheles cruzii]|uniref:probable RNA methyltransferase CG11342 n=1 Tax=Anopheles cruzii TaxID=68878 RepID=UPI0022EC847C|nr:probable RNA methyltransferase CG11342 [Anopheles cruzii]
MEVNQVKNGNYHHYYDFRASDSRSAILKALLEALDGALRQPSDESLFLLDVGCNLGHFTAKVKCILHEVTGRKISAAGLDIDPVLCERASSVTPDVAFLCGNILEIATERQPEDPVADYMRRHGIAEFDVVCCFSVLMYVHLNGGDDGLRSALDYLCRRGKFLILELQPWKKYRDQVRRLKRSSGEEYPRYGDLAWRGGCGKLEGFITGHIVGNGFELLQESSERSEFDRQLWVFRRKANNI